MIAGCTDFGARAGTRFADAIDGLSIELRGGLSLTEADKRVAQAHRTASFRPDGRMTALQWKKWNTARAKLEAELDRSGDSHRGSRHP